MFDPKDFLTFARSCTGLNSSSEASYRSAISRAYYAAFLSVRNYCDSEDIPIEGNASSSHENVVRAMWDFPDHHRYDMAKELKRLKQLRKNADYVLEYSQAAQDSQKAIDDAEDFIKWVNALPTSK